MNIYEEHFFQALALGNHENLCYLIGKKNSSECICIDPGWEGEKILEILKQEEKILSHIFLTHLHYDHSGQADFLSHHTGATIHASHLARSKPSHHSFIIPSRYHSLREGLITVSDLQIQIIESPGHQRDHLLFIIDNAFLFSGDTLFIGRIGRMDFIDSSSWEMSTTLEKIKSLPEHLEIYSGHNYGEVLSRSLKEEKQKNPYLNGQITLIKREK